MSSSDPPLSRSTATLLVIAAALVLVWVLSAAYHAPVAKAAVSISETGMQP